ncbi:glycosyltransferase [Bacillus sp. J37]|uniref:glycosyltransferase n=1 Tax=Bacillus sp. J37 TaxID=935837 RepID=UPI0004B88D57|nr:glycosyltransferase [Bacillus sp. J37]
MFHNAFLTFNDKSSVSIPEQIFLNVQNTFTIEFWAKPKGAHIVDQQSKKGITTTNNKQFVIVPIYGAIGDGNSTRAGVGVSVGTNGVSIYEHTLNHLPATLVENLPIHDWTHIAIVYNDKTPNLFINGNLVKRGLSSTKRIVVPSGIFGGMDNFGSYIGSLSEVRIWGTARTKSEIKQNMRQELTGNENGLFGYWKLNEGTGTILYDSTQNKKNGFIHGAKWNTLQQTVLNIKSNKVLFQFLVPSGGVETLNRQRFYALKKQGIYCHFLYAKEGTGLQNKIETSIFITDIDAEIKDILNNGNYRAIVVLDSIKLIKKIRDFGYKGPLIYETQGLGHNIQYAEQFLKEQAYDTINNYCDAILYPVTPHLIKAFNSVFPHKPKYCFQNCFDSEEFKYEVHPTNKRPIIGWVGRLEPNKNWKDFLLIGAKLIKEDPSIQLWMFEDNTLSAMKERAAFEQKIEELNLKNHLTIYANQPHRKMAEYYSIIGDSGGFLCSTSKVEGFGYAVLEAMICRCPVLSTDSEGVRSFIKHNNTGKFFTLGNINQAVQEGRELMTNMHLREQIRYNGFKHIELHFSPKAYAENFMKMISEVEILKS